MAKREATYETDDATIWQVVEADGAEHWETQVGIQRVLRFETEAEAIAHVRKWEGEALHDRSYQAMSSSSVRPRGRR